MFCKIQLVNAVESESNGMKSTVQTAQRGWLVQSKMVSKIGLDIGPNANANAEKMGSNGLSEGPIIVRFVR